MLVSAVGESFQRKKTSFAKGMCKQNLSLNNAVSIAAVFVKFVITLLVSVLEDVKLISILLTESSLGSEKKPMLFISGAAYSYF